MAVPYTFGSATTSIPLSQLDSNFATAITLGNTAVQLGNTITTLTGLTSVTTSGDSTISGLTVGKGGGSVSTNTAVGVSALNSNTTGAGEVAVGYQALNQNSTGSYNTAIGQQAGYKTTGANNTFVGYVAGYENTTGVSNTAVGFSALFNGAATASSGSYNTAVGQQALNANTTASNNTAVGYQAGYTNSTGAGNTYIGRQAGTLSTGIGNTFVGAGGYYTNGAGAAMTTGSKNTILGGYDGNQASLDIRTASNYIVLSDGEGNPRLIFNNASPPDALIGCTSNSGVQTATAGGFVCDGSNHLWITRSGAGGATVDIGRTGGAGTGGYLEWWYNGTNTGTVSTNGSTTTYGTSSDYRLKDNIAPMTGALDKVAQLKPVTYKWKTSGLDGEGFIAHELAEVVPEAVFGEKDGTEVYKDDDGNDQTRPKYQSVDTSFLVATLTAAIQELKTIVDAQAAEIAELKAKVA